MYRKMLCYFEIEREKSVRILFEEILFAWLFFKKYTSQQIALYNGTVGLSSEKEERRARKVETCLGQTTNILWIFQKRERCIYSALVYSIEIKIPLQS